MARTDELIAEGFTPAEVNARRLNIEHVDPADRGPFCRLFVEADAPNAAGVDAWVTNEDVRYIGKARELVQIVKGARMQRAYNDYTYIPASKIAQLSNPRVRVNGLLNRAIVRGDIVTWWWLQTDSELAALALEAVLIERWKPPWNRARPTILPSVSGSAPPPELA